jgi:DNA-binding XRE family transcriptional regulator
MNNKIAYDVYRGTSDRTLRLATMPGAGLPAHVRSPRSPGAVDKYIGARTREGRCALNMTQESLGELLGVTFQQIQKYESGRNRVSAARLFEICETLNVSLASMFERKLKD